MLDDCLNYLCHKMNESIRTSFDLTEDIVVVSPPTDTDTHGMTSIENKILVFISNLEKDTFSKPGPQMTAFQAGQRSAISNKPLYLSISVVIAAHFSGMNYTDGLKILSHLFAFCHRNPVFNRQNAPDLPETLEQLVLEMETIPSGELSHMWSMLGSRYLPSCVYKVRAVIPNSETILTQVGQLSLTDTNLFKKDA
ncbi:hypothetical protein MSP8886_02303 [Marinomonas spartinae]|uniref:Pvc16 N-terminal domain-containing protein n=1 Tax=Marinomonas spartinae TaxID=1792290 RepID=A0A1A8TIJ9_9GAMM|nr:DUF4255 domain-containing protein [Marinomonas spartinae]SBS31988.1 hypothetical protein MSP8886_02303 [Marinomonas spartinae]